MAISMIKELNARIQAMIAKINFSMPTITAPTGSGSYKPYSEYTVPEAIEKVKETNQRIQDMINEINRGGAGVQRSSSQSPMDIRVTVDAGGDRLSQAIAESIQVATRSGYSTVPAGFLV